jgi:hypothetical protein
MYILTHSKIFVKKSDPHSPDFYNRFQQVVKNIKGFLNLILLADLIYSQIWLNLIVDDGQLVITYNPYFLAYDTQSPR